MAVVSKAMANGYAISAFLGRRDVMQAMDKGLFSATFFVSSLEMAASIATINVIKRDDVIGYIWKKGEKFLHGLAEICSGTRLDVEPVGVAPMPFLRFQMADENLNQKVKMAFYAEAARLGVYFHPNHHWFVNFSHTDEDIERTLEVCEKSMRVAEKAADVG
jgi:glutamate-1-semialdehyde aminotransferase